MRELLPDLVGKTVLDVGCGSGIDLEYFKAKGAAHLTGADIAQELISIAKEKLPDADIRDDSFAYLSWKDSSFDIVWSKYALSHAKDIVPPLKELWRVCKKNGIVLLQVMHPMRSASLLMSQDYFDEGTAIKYPLEDGKYLSEPHHTVAGWINGITESGFDIVRSEEILNRPKKDYKPPITPSALIFILKK